MRKRAASGKSTSCWRLSFWLFSIGFRIITALFHKEKSERFRPDFFAVENQKAAISPNPVQRCSPKITQAHLNSGRKTEG